MNWEMTILDIPVERATMHTLLNHPNPSPLYYVTLDSILTENQKRLK